MWMLNCVKLRRRTYELIYIYINVRLSSLVSYDDDHKLQDCNGKAAINTVWREGKISTSREHHHSGKCTSLFCGECEWVCVSVCDCKLLSCWVNGRGSWLEKYIRSSASTQWYGRWAVWTFTEMQTLSLFVCGALGIRRAKQNSSNSKTKNRLLWRLEEKKNFVKPDKKTISLCLLTVSTYS